MLRCWQRCFLSGWVVGFSETDEDLTSLFIKWKNFLQQLKRDFVPTAALANPMVGRTTKSICIHKVGECNGTRRQGHGRKGPSTVTTPHYDWCGQTLLYFFSLDRRRVDSSRLLASFAASPHHRPPVSLHAFSLL